MRNKSVIILMMMLLCVGVLACEKKETIDESNHSTQADETVNVEQEDEVTEKIQDNTEFYLPKEETDELEEEYRILVKEVQENLKDKDMEEMSELISYPCYVGIENVISVRNKEEFMQLDMEQVFTEELIQIIEETDVDSLELQDAGYVISGESGRPSITIGRGEDGKIGITGFNY